MGSALKQAVEGFLKTISVLSDGDLERPWEWREYDLTSL